MGRKITRVVGGTSPKPTFLMIEFELGHAIVVTGTSECEDGDVYTLTTPATCLTMHSNGRSGLA